jgi:tetratricopeptide (TPR) repeat protein
MQPGRLCQGTPLFRSHIARTHLEEALQIYRQIGDRRGESSALAYLSLLSHHLGKDEAAIQLSQQGLAIASSIGARDEEGRLLNMLGHALVASGNLEDAKVAYQQALDLRRELGQHHLTQEPLAGLARVCLSQGDLPQALALLEQILTHLETGTLEGADEPVRVHLTCYRVLASVGDPRAGFVLKDGYKLLQEGAARIEEQGVRRAFLENVPANRELKAAWELEKKA